jgi:hypothetical protein
MSLTKPAPENAPRATRKGLWLVLIIGIGSLLTYLFIDWMGRLARQQDVVGNTLQAEVFNVLGSEAKVLVINQDINGDGKPDAVAALLHKHRRILPPEATWVDQLVVLHVQKRKSVIHLRADGESLRGANREPLLNMAPAKHGYILRYGTDDQKHLEFNLTLADTLGQDASEAIRLVWDAQTGRYVVQGPMP